MTELHIPDSCGNSPKASTLKELVTGIALADPHMLRQIVADDVRWCPVGAREVSGADAVCRALTRHGAATSLRISHIVVHGRSGAADGESNYGRKQRAFYIVVDFTSAKGERIRRIRSFSTDIRKSAGD
jgi:hypothetical protein